MPDEFAVVEEQNVQSSGDKTTDFVKKHKTKLILGLVLLILVVALYYYRDEIKAMFVKDAPTIPAAEHMKCGCRRGKCGCGERMTMQDLPIRRKAEYLTSPDDDVETDAEVLNELGYEGSLPWSDILSATELDPTIQDNHNQFVADVRRFSSGANFTAVADDDNNLAFTNFIGLNRPQHVPIGADARQQPDIDQSVLQRNKYIRF